jgi:hypothetical protein
VQVIDGDVAEQGGSSSTSTSTSTAQKAKTKPVLSVPATGPPTTYTQRPPKKSSKQGKRK